MHSYGPLHNALAFKTKEAGLLFYHQRLQAMLVKMNLTNLAVPLTSKLIWADLTLLLQDS
jgi:hypothetical protein